MAISLTLDHEQSSRLEKRAHELGVAPQDLGRALLNDLLNRSGEDFDRISKFVLDKNLELYRRLS
jgi:antitoxin FitA